MIAEKKIERTGKTQANTRDTPYQHEKQAPDPNSAVQVPIQASEAHSPLNPHTTLPILYSRPPDYGARGAHDYYEKGSDAVDGPAIQSREQIIVQIREPPDETNGFGPGIAEILARVGIEQAGDALASVFQDGKIRAVRLLRFAKAENLVTGIGSDDALLNFPRTRASAASRGGHCHAARRDPANLPAAYDSAAGDADRHHIEAHSDSHPQMDLKQNLAKQQALWVVDVFLPDRPVPAVIRRF